MASTPFSTTATTYPGQMLGKVTDRVGTPTAFWMGPAGGLVQLPFPNVNYDAIRSQGEAETVLLGGGSAVTRLVNLKRRYTFTYGRLGGRDWQIIDGFYRRVFGSGPWYLITPDDRNRLPGSAAMCGGLNSDISKWAASAGTLSIDTTDTAPVTPSGILQWAGAGNGSLLTVGTFTGANPTPDIPTITSNGTGIPYTLALPVACSLWARTATSTASVNLRASGRTTGGTVATEVTGTTTTLTTTWQELTVLAAANALGSTATYVLPVLKCNTASAPNILIAAAQVEFDTAVTDWTVGNHVPRMLIPASMGRALDPRVMNSVTVTLAEA